MDIIDNIHNVRAEVIHIYDSFSAVACELWAILWQFLWLTFASNRQWVKWNLIAANIQFLRLSGFSSHIHNRQSNLQVTFTLKLQHYYLFLRTKNRTRITSNKSLKWHAMCHYTIILNALNKKFMFVPKMPGKHIHLLCISLNWLQLAWQSFHWKHLQRDCQVILADIC